MSQLPARRGSRAALLTAAVGIGGLVALPASASADAHGPNSCDASALRLSVLGGTALDPIHANPNGTPCVNADGTLINIPNLLGLLDAQVVEATTRNIANSAAASHAKVAGLHVGVDGIVGQLTGPLLSGPNSIVGQVDGLVNGLLGPLVGAGGPLNGLIGNLPLVGGIAIGGIDNGGLLQSLTGSLSGALSSALPDVLKADVIEARASAQCVNNAPQLSGSSQIAGLQVLGTGIDANGAANQLLSLDTAHLNLGQVLSVNEILKNIKVEGQGVLGIVLGAAIGTTQTNLYDLLYTQNASILGAVNSLIAALSGGQTLGSILTGITNTLQPLLNSIQVDLPPGLLHAKVTPNGQVISGGHLSQNALSLSVSALGQPILDGTIAQAQVGAGSPGCVPPNPGPGPKPKDDDKGKGAGDGKFPSPGAQALLQCTSAPLTLIDVGAAGSKTFIYGVARSEFVGKTATIYLKHGKKKVGTAKVDSDGFFSTKVALPPSKIRKTNKARYYASIDGQKTRALKFARRMQVSRLTTADGKVTMRGNTTAPRRSKQSSIVIKQRIGCKKYKTLKTVKPNSKGRFTATFKSPAAGEASVYRAQTHVPRTTRSKKQIRTFTLPRVAGL